MNFRDQPVTGFTLELNGPHEEIDRILSVVWREMERIAIYNRTLEAPQRIGSFGLVPGLVPGLAYSHDGFGYNVRGTLTVRSDV